MSTKTWLPAALFAILIATGLSGPAAAAKKKAAAPPAKAKLTAIQIAKKAWWAGKLDGVEMISTLTIISASGQRRVRRTAAVSKLSDGGKTEKRLIRFLHPADVKGTSFLSYDYEQRDDSIWIYLPALRKVRRIVSSEKSKNFMGSEFTYADMTPPSVESFKYRIIKSETLRGVDCWVIEAKPKNKTVASENGFSKRISWVGKADYVFRKAVYYDLKGKLHRELNAYNVKLLDRAKKRYRALRMVMVNKQNKRKSIMHIGRIRLRATIPDRYFTTRFLERM